MHSELFGLVARASLVGDSCLVVNAPAAAVAAGLEGCLRSASPSCVTDHSLQTRWAPRPRRQALRRPTREPRARFTRPRQLRALGRLQRPHRRQEPTAGRRQAPTADRRLPPPLLRPALTMPGRLRQLPRQAPLQVMCNCNRRPADSLIAAKRLKALGCGTRPRLLALPCQRAFDSLPVQGFPW